MIYAVRFHVVEFHTVGFHEKELKPTVDLNTVLEGKQYFMSLKYQQFKRNLF